MELCRLISLSMSISPFSSYNILNLKMEKSLVAVKKKKKTFETIPAKLRLMFVHLSFYPADKYCRKSSSSQDWNLNYCRSANNCFPTYNAMYYICQWGILRRFNYKICAWLERQTKKWLNTNQRINFSSASSRKKENHLQSFSVCLQ